jgi:hypothetical protein
MSPRAAPLWTCPDCGRRFANRRQVHTCRPPSGLDRHFAGSEANVRETFDAFVAAVRDAGPFEIVPQKTRIALHARMSFAALIARRRWLNGHLVLAERVDDPAFHRVTTYSPRNHVHEFRLHGADEIDDRFRSHIAAAYVVGMQRHLDSSGTADDA